MQIRTSRKSGRTGREAFRSLVGRDPGRVPFGTLQPKTPKPLPPEALYHWWHPDRDGSEPCPKHFDVQLKEVHKDLAICRPPANAPTASRAWIVWYRVPRITHYLCPGWQLLFVWQAKNEDNPQNVQLTPLPLDARIFANLMRVSAKQFGNAVKYFESVVATMKADKQKQNDEQKQYRDDRRKDYWQSTKIKNIGRGNKFALHHDGSVVPSRGEANWLADQGDRAMPGDVAKARKNRTRITRKSLRDLPVRRGPR